MKRGADHWQGPVVVASVIMPADSMIEGVNDSKKVSEKKKREIV